MSTLTISPAFGGRGGHFKDTQKPLKGYSIGYLLIRVVKLEDTKRYIHLTYVWRNRCAG